MFVDFLEAERITGTVLGNAILEWLERNEISPADMRGQCYDGALNMSTARAGAKSIVQKKLLPKRCITTVQRIASTCQ